MNRVGPTCALILVTGALLPGAASANIDCSHATVQANNVAGTSIDVGVQAGPGGLSGTANAAVGACIDGLSGLGSSIDGGAIEAGAGLGKGSTPGAPGVYAVADGDDANTDPTPADQTGGYMGLSNYETDGTAPPCGTGDGTNSGGCFYVKPLALGLPIPLIACGNTSGKAWSDTTRDGCSVP